MYCSYYKAKILRNKLWFVTGILKNEENWVFDRTLDKNNDILEFFVIPDFEEEFLYFMELFQKGGIVITLEKLPNRLIDNKLI